jgi:hypothetical protein
VPQLEDEAEIEAIGYYLASTDVQGQGKHYVNNQNWDGVFDPRAPEGLVYNNGRLVAQLYVADANVVGLGTHTVGPCSPGCAGAEYNIELETAADGPQCSPACSWDGAEVWHLHHYLCTINIGTATAAAIPGSFAPSVGNSLAACDAYSDSQTSPDAPLCSVPVTTQPCYQWQQHSGWMGHLYNWIPNANRIPDQATEDLGDPQGQGPCTDGIDNGLDGLTDGADPDCTYTNGRFADCYPDVEGWKATNCPG